MSGQIRYAPVYRINIKTLIPKFGKNAPNNTGNMISVSGVGKTYFPEKELSIQICYKCLSIIAPSLGQSIPNFPFEEM